MNPNKNQAAMGNAGAAAVSAMVVLKKKRDEWTTGERKSKEKSCSCSRVPVLDASVLLCCAAA